MSGKLIFLILFTALNLYFLVSRFKKSGKSGGPAGNGSAEFFIRLTLLLVVLLGLAGIWFLTKGAGVP
jgi:hypothetical protein